MGRLVHRLKCKFQLRQIWNNFLNDVKTQDSRLKVRSLRTPDLGPRAVGNHTSHEVASSSEGWHLSVGRLYTEQLLDIPQEGLVEVANSEGRIPLIIYLITEELSAWRQLQWPFLDMVHWWAISQSLQPCHLLPTLELPLCRIILATSI